jgi:hypothetical protein
LTDFVGADDGAGAFACGEGVGGSLG